MSADSSSGDSRMAGSEGQVLGVIDGDLQHPPHVLSAVAQLMQEQI